MGKTKKSLYDLDKISKNLSKKQISQIHEAKQNRKYKNKLYEDLDDEVDFYFKK